MVGGATFLIAIGACCICARGHFGHKTLDRVAFVESETEALDLRGASLKACVMTRTDLRGALLVIAGLYVLINFAIDMLYLLVDPRVRY